MADDTVIKKTKGVKQQITSGSEGEYENVIFIEPIVDGATPSGLAFKKLEQSVNVIKINYYKDICINDFNYVLLSQVGRLEQRFEALDELSTNPELVERLKGNITDPLTDMWNIININKRLDATEQGMDKVLK